MNEGFYIRIPGSDRPFGEKCPKTPLIFLTSNVARLLQFLGLPLEPYGRPFESCETYWRWVTSARHLAREFLQPRFELGKSSAREESSKDKRVSGYTSGLAYYFSRRDSMRMFTDDWLPLHPQIGTNEPDVEAIFQEALEFFHARDRYHVQWSTYIMDRREEQFWAKVIAKLSDIKHAELLRQREIEKRVWEDMSTSKGRNLVTCELARAPEVDKSGKKALDELEQKETKKIRKTVNEAVITLKRRVVFEAHPGYRRYPVVKEEPKNDVDHPKWLAQLAEGGLTEDELLDWIARHGFPLLKNERDRTRPAREAKRVAKKQAVDREKYSDAVRVDLVKETLGDGVMEAKTEGFKIKGFKT